jgi:hypothetical protein
MANLGAKMVFYLSSAFAGFPLNFPKQNHSHATLAQLPVNSAWWET